MNTRLTDFDSEPERIEITVTGARLERHVRIVPEEEQGIIYTTRSRSYVSKVVNRIKTYLANA